MDEMTMLRELRADAPVPDRARLEPGRRRLTEALERRTARRRPHTDWRLTAVGAAAAVAAAALIGGQLLPGGADDAGPGSKTVQVHRDLGDVDALLEAAARTAERRPDPRPHAGQWVYEKKVRGHERQKQPGDSRVQEHWYRYADPAFENGKEGDDHSPRERYRFLADLPQDAPDEVLQRVRAAYPASKGEDRAEHDFRAVSVVLGTYPADPEGMAAVLRALKTVDGVAAVDHLVTDAHGDEAIAVHGTGKGKRIGSQLLFDPRTMAYIGDRSVVLHDYTMGWPGDEQPENAPPPTEMKKGDVLINSLVLEHALVARKGDRP